MQKNGENMFYNAFEAVLSGMTKRSFDIISKRFGVGIQKPLTLQAIGDEYSITRERVRQITQGGLQNVNRIEDCEECQSAKDVILEYVSRHHGIVSLNNILKDLGGDDNKEIGSIRFFVEGMSELDTVNTKKYPVVEQVVVLHDFDIDTWHKIHNTTKEILEQRQKTHRASSLFEEVSKHHEEIEDHDQLVTYLNVSCEIDQNPFEKWGLCTWDEITPRGVREKALLIMREEKRPMHFKEIAQAMDDYGLSKKGKKSHPQTVHNELIRDDNFVLVGRGVYSLKTKDYVDGTVKDVIEKVLEQSDEPLTTEEIIERVLQKRQVKPATIKVNLNVVAKKMNKGYTLERNES